MTDAQKDQLHDYQGRGRGEGCGWELSTWADATT